MQTTSTIAADQIAHLVKRALPVVAHRIRVVGHQIELKKVRALLQRLWLIIWPVLQLVVPGQNQFDLDEVPALEFVQFCLDLNFASRVHISYLTPLHIVLRSSNCRLTELKLHSQGMKSNG